MKFTSLIFLFFLLFGNDSSKETILFDVVRKNKVVGELKATKDSKSDLVIYNSTTTINAHFLKEIKVEFEYKVTFHNDKLISSKADLQVNGRMHEKTNTQWKGKTYEVTYKRKDKKVIEESIGYSSQMLLFEEPKKVSRTFSERDGKFHKIESYKKNSYKKTNSKGRVNKYFYDNEKLQRAEINAGLVKFKLIRK